MKDVFFYIIAMVILGYFLSFQWTRIIVEMEKRSSDYVVEIIRTRDLFKV